MNAALATEAPSSPLDLLRRARAMVSTRWVKGDAAAAMLSMNGPHLDQACCYFIRANGYGQKVAIFEATCTSRQDILAALDRSIALAAEDETALDGHPF